MKKQNRLVTPLISAGILCAGYLLTRYVLFDLHGMRQWPLVLFLCGLLAIAVSCHFRARFVPLFTAVSYVLGFVLGLVFQSDYSDAGGARANNLWIIWTVLFLCVILASACGELIISRRRRQNA